MERRTGMDPYASPTVLIFPMSLCILPAALKGPHLRTRHISRVLSGFSVRDKMAIVFLQGFFVYELQSVFPTQLNGHGFFTIGITLGVILNYKRGPYVHFQGSLDSNKANTDSSSYEAT